MDSHFFQDFRQSLERFNCLKPAVTAFDLHNFSTVLDNFDTLHSRQYSYTVDENPLSQTMPNCKISLNTENQDESTYKLIAESVKTNNVKLFRKYLNMNMNIAQVNKKKRNFLHMAAKCDSLEVCQLILAYTQIGINSRDSEMKSPLHLAAIYGNGCILQYLHRCGGYLHVKDNLHNSVIDYIIEGKNPEMIKFVFEKFPSLCKSFGFNIQELLKQQGISLESKKTIGNDEKSKVKKLQDPSEDEESNTIEFIQELGKGSFGLVYLVRSTETSDLYALKIMTKEKIFNEKLEVYIQTEKEVMSILNSDFIVKLHSAFQTPQYFCLLMDYCAGGTLADLLNKTRCLSEARAKKYLTEVLIALETLHKFKILYRDLKPENILIDESGHIKITDFGLAKQGISDEQSAKSFCGTVSYIAPEVGEKGKYGKCADWYAYGVLMYELLTGTVPFSSARQKSKGFRVPKYISDSGRRLIEGLLCVEPTKRIGYRGAEEVKEQEFFAGVNWEVVKNKGNCMDLPNLIEIRKEVMDKSLLPSAPKMKNLDGWNIIETI